WMAVRWPAAVCAFLQEAPALLEFCAGERLVGVLPVHPHPEPARLLGDHGAELRHALLAPLGELGEAVVLDLALRTEAERAFDLDLDPEALRVEAVLITLVEAAHRPVALEHVFERAAPGVMDAHRVVRGDGAVDKGEAGPPAVLLPQPLE